MSVLNLHCTAAAIEAYDEYRDKVHAIEEAGTASKLDLLAMWFVLDHLADIVGQAFADDTKDINAPEVAVLVRPDPRFRPKSGNWLRGLLRSQGLYHGLPEA